MQSFDWLLAQLNQRLILTYIGATGILWANRRFIVGAVFIVGLLMVVWALWGQTLSKYCLYRYIVSRIVCMLCFLKADRQTGFIMYFFFIYLNQTVGWKSKNPRQNEEQNEIRSKHTYLHYKCINSIQAFSKSRKTVTIDNVSRQIIPKTSHSVSEEKGIGIGRKSTWLRIGH